VDLTDFDEVRQVAIDHGLVCGKEYRHPSHGTREAACTLGDTMIRFATGDGYDGLAALRRAHSSCPIVYGGSHPIHGQIWAGDGYYVSLFNFGPSNELELALTEDLGVDPSCEITTPPPPFG
jgi:hypothetical protein